MVSDGDVTVSVVPSRSEIDTLTRFRRDLHRQPGLAFDVGHTAAAIAERLRRAGLHVVENVGRTGVVATLTRGDSPRAIGLRADMDALPIIEANDFDHHSVQRGLFHGCGHDGHSTLLLGAALTLAKRASLNGTVYFIFQPDEENGTGADAMIDDGLFERFPMSAVFGLHNLPGLPIGHFGIQAGPFCSFEDNFEIQVRGRGGHASMPHLAVDPIVVGAEIVTALQSIVARNVPPSDHAVVSVTDFETDGARNVIASNVCITGDCRGFEARTSELIRRRMEDIVRAVAGAHGAEAEVSYTTSFVPVVNHPDATALCAAVVDGLSAATLHHPYGRVGFSEDFAKMLLHRPGAYILMGNGDDGPHHSQPLHNPHYDFNDAAIPVGVGYWCALAEAALAHPSINDWRLPSP